MSRKVAGSIPEFFIGLIFRPHYGLQFDSAFNRHEYQEYFLGGKGGWCLRLKTLSLSYANCLEIWEPQPPGTIGFSRGLYGNSFT